MSKILIVDDEPALVEVLQGILTREHHITDVAEDGNEALALLQLSPYELIILDVMLPGVDGFEICRRYRSRGGDASILMLTAKASVDDRARGLDLGADDYLPKPFHLKEFLSRVRALLRRSNGTRSNQLINIGELAINLQTRTLRRRGQTICLTPKEFDLLIFLARHKGVPFTAEQLVERAWQSDAFTLEETVRSHIRNIRKKLDTFGSPSVIRHVRGYGYMMAER